MKNGNDTTEMILNTEGIGVTYQESIIALKNVSLNVPAAKLTSILGPSGCGKTTLLKVIAGIYYPSEGKIQTEGTISSLLDVGSILKPDCTGYENIKLFWLHYNKSVSLDGLTQNVEEFSDLDDLISSFIGIVDII